MATFKLEISTPDSQFYSAQAEAITMRSRTGSLTVLAGHAPMLVSVQPGEIRIKADGEWRSLLSMDGFAEVTGDSVEMFTRAAVWEDEAEARPAKRRSAKRLKSCATRRAFSSMSTRKSSLPARSPDSANQKRTEIYEKIRRRRIFLL